MFSRFYIRFIPDSLANYYDELRVISQASRPLVIKIVAEREAPALTGMLIAS